MPRGRTGPRTKRSTKTGGGSTKRETQSCCLSEDIPGIFPNMSDDRQYQTTQDVEGTQARSVGTDTQDSSSSHSSPVQ